MAELRPGDDLQPEGDLASHVIPDEIHTEPAVEVTSKDLVQNQLATEEGQGSNVPEPKDAVTFIDEARLTPETPEDPSEDGTGGYQPEPDPVSVSNEDDATVVRKDQAGSPEGPPSAGADSPNPPRPPRNISRGFDDEFEDNDNNIDWLRRVGPPIEDADDIRRPVNEPVRGDNQERYAGEFDEPENELADEALHGDAPDVNNLRNEMIAAESRKLFGRLGRFSYSAMGRDLNAEDDLELLVSEDMTDDIPDEKRLESEADIGRQADVVWRFGNADMNVTARSLSEHIIDRLTHVEEASGRSVPIVSLHINLREQINREDLETGYSDWIFNLEVNLYRNLPAEAVIVVGKEYDEKFRGEVLELAESLGLSELVTARIDGTSHVNRISSLEPEQLGRINDFARKFLPDYKSQ